MLITVMSLCVCLCGGVSVCVDMKGGGACNGGATVCLCGVCTVAGWDSAVCVCVCL